MNNHQPPNQRKIKKEDIPAIIVAIAGVVVLVGLAFTLRKGSR